MIAVTAGPFATPALRCSPNFGISNRKYAELEPLATRRKQTAATRSNRQFLHGWIFRRISLTVARRNGRDGSPLLPGHAIRPPARRLVRWNRRGGGRQRRWRGILCDGRGLLRRQWRHQRERVVAQRHEFVPVALRYWIGWRQRKVLEIQEFFAALHAEIQMRAGGNGGHPHQANPAALP